MAWQYHTVLSLPLADPLRADSSHRYANHTKRGRERRGGPYGAWHVPYMHTLCNESTTSISLCHNKQMNAGRVCLHEQQNVTYTFGYDHVTGDALCFIRPFQFSIHYTPSRSHQRFNCLPIKDYTHQVHLVAFIGVNQRLNIVMTVDIAKRRIVP